MRVELTWRPPVSHLPTRPPGPHHGAALPSLAWGVARVKPRADRASVVRLGCARAALGGVRTPASRDAERGRYPGLGGPRNVVSSRRDRRHSTIHRPSRVGPRPRKGHAASLAECRQVAGRRAGGKRHRLRRRRREDRRRAAGGRRTSRGPRRARPRRATARRPCKMHVRRSPGRAPTASAVCSSRTTCWRCAVEGACCTRRQARHGLPEAGHKICSIGISTSGAADLARVR